MQTADLQSSQYSICAEVEENVRQLLQAGALGVVLQFEVTETGPHVSQLQLQSLILTARHVVTALAPQLPYPAITLKGSSIQGVFSA